MSKQTEIENLAIFCDFENVAIGVRDAHLPPFDVRKILERLLLKGNIVVKKAYCDWARYKEFKAGMHEAAFELIEIPHVRQSGKNSADIRMVVDALDLCYTKAHVDTFVVVSGDSDFSPLVSKLRENNKHVIGVGVRNSSSDLLIANCDDFIFYESLLQGRRGRRSAPPSPAAAHRSRAESRGNERAVRDETASERPTQPEDAPSQEALDLLMETLEALAEERGAEDKIWGSMVKQALKRRRPGFAESSYGFRSFNRLLEEAAARQLVQLEPDERSGGYIILSGR